MGTSQCSLTTTEMFRILGKLLRAPRPEPVDVLEGWSTIRLDNRRVDIFEPDSGRPEGCVLFLHGHGRVFLNENRTFSQLFHDHRLAAICPDGARAWWLDRRCPEFDQQLTPIQWIRQSVIPLVASRWEICPPGIALLGVSMGGQGVLQLAYRFARDFPVVAAISPAIDFHQLYGQDLPLDAMYDNAEEARQDTVVLNLHPLSWPRYQYFCCDPADADWFDGCSRLAMKLSSSGIMHERDLATSAGGHSWCYFNQMASAALEYIAKGLQSVADTREDPLAATQR